VQWIDDLIIMYYQFFEWSHYRMTGTSCPNNLKINTSVQKKTKKQRNSYDLYGVTTSEMTDNEGIGVKWWKM